MDIRADCIPWGAKWESELQGALASCDALIVLIGPQWLKCEQPAAPGCRRLDAPNDWVRGEIAAVLHRREASSQNVLVLPVLIGGAQAPLAADLPIELRSLGFASIQAKTLSEGHWDTEVDELIDTLRTSPKLRQLHDLATTKKGIEGLLDLIRKNAVVADAVGRSREIIETTDHEISELRTYKELHDALHTIEAECLTTLRVDSSQERLAFSKLDFTAPSRFIRTASNLHQPSDPLLQELVDRLDHISRLFDEATAENASSSRDALIGELEELISYFPDQLHHLISLSATRLRLDRLMQLMATVKSVLPDTASQDAELKPMLESIEALAQLQERLNQLVREHGLLQRLDLNLRRVCVGMRSAHRSSTSKPLAAAFEWEQIERQRARLQPPFSPELLQAGIAGLEPLELQTKASVEAGNESAAIGNFARYFHLVGNVFRALDSSLKDFCTDLDRESQGLRLILQQLEDSHV